jgi:hypothetical protein
VFLVSIANPAGGVAPVDDKVPTEVLVQKPGLIMHAGIVLVVV